MNRGGNGTVEFMILFLFLCLIMGFGLILFRFLYGMEVDSFRMAMKERHRTLTTLRPGIEPMSYVAGDNAAPCKVEVIEGKERLICRVYDE